MKAKIFISIVLISLITSCSIEVRIPTNRMDSPETRGKRDFYIDIASWQKYSTVLLTSDSEFEKVNTKSPKINKDMYFLQNVVGYGITDRFDLCFKLNYLSYGMIQGKYQIIGSNYQDIDKGFKLAVTAGIGGNDEETSKKNKNEEKTEVSKLDTTVFDGAIIAGYRIDQFFMFYGGVFISYYEFEGTQNYQSTEIIPFKGNALVKGANLGLELDVTQVVYVKAESAISHIKSGDSVAFDYFIGFSTGITF